MFAFLNSFVETLCTELMLQVVLKKLWVGTRYFYRCGDPEGGWSPVYSFVTRKKPEVPIQFAVFSDQVSPVHMYPLICSTFELGRL